MLWGILNAHPCSVVFPGEDSSWNTFQGPPAPQLMAAVCPCMTGLFWIIQACFSNTWSSRVDQGRHLDRHP